MINDTLNIFRTPAAEQGDAIKLSLFVACYNEEENIEPTLRTVDAACAEVGITYEVIVVDDGSTDGTERVCATFDERIRYRKVSNDGVSRARNIGAEMASGEWLLFLDSDDRLRPEGPESLVAVAGEVGAGVAYGLVSEEQKPPLEPRITGQAHAAGAPPHPASRNYWRCAVITPGSAVIRRDLHERIGGFIPGFEPMEDRDYWIKAGLLASCAHADRVVLEKTWRPVSAGKMDARRIWNGLRSRLALPTWCEKIGVAWPEELPRNKKVLLEKAVNEAVWYGCWEIVGALLQECRKAGLRTFWTMRAAAEFVLRGGSRRWPRPGWVMEIGE